MSIEDPTPEETVVALLEQGHAVTEIVAEAERNWADAQAGIEWVDACALELGGKVDDREAIVRQEKRVYESLGRKAPGSTAETRARLALGDLEIAGQEHALARAAAENHARHANETITNAQRRIAAANDPTLVKPAIERHKAAKALEAANAKDPSLANNGAAAQAAAA